MKNRIEIAGGNNIFAMDMRESVGQHAFDTVVVIDRNGCPRIIGKPVKVRSLDNGGHRIEPLDEQE